MIRVAILISGSGSNMVALVDSMVDDHPARPVLVLANVPSAPGLAKAAARGVPTAVVDHTAYADRAAFEVALRATLDEAQPDLICLAGFMRILTHATTNHYAGRILNIHPSLLPKFPGLDTYARALAAGEVVHGCTVHEVTAALDQGPILGQALVPVDPGDTAERLAQRVLKAEHRLYPAVLRRVAAGDRTPLILE